MTRGKLWLLCAVLANYLTALIVTNAPLAAEPTPSQCVPQLTRDIAVLMMAERARWKKGGEAYFKDSKKRQNGIFQVKYRQLVFKRLVERDDPSSLEAAWRRSPSVGKISGCIDLYNTYRKAGRINPQDEAIAADEANEWLQEAKANDWVEKELAVATAKLRKQEDAERLRKEPDSIQALHGAIDAEWPTGMSETVIQEYKRDAFNDATAVCASLVRSDSPDSPEEQMECQKIAYAMGIKLRQRMLHTMDFNEEGMAPSE